MKNEKRFFLISVGVWGISALLTAFLSLLVSCGNQGTRSEFSETKGNALGRPELLDSILSNEIVFYGQVLDLEGNPIPNAEVRYSALNFQNFDKVWTSGTSKKAMFTDMDGRFAIHDVGGSLFVNCKHPEYYGTRGHAEPSQRKFSYGFQSGDDPAWHPQNPAIFRLRKKGVCEPLYFSCDEMVNKGKSSRTRLSSGECIVIDLAKGVRGESDTSVSVSYESDKVPELREGYDWEYTLRIPGGGFIEKQENFDFIAPEKGYKEEVKIGYKKTDEGWCDFKRCFYFVRFSNGLYGVFEIKAGVRGNGRFRFRALVNPNPASRNLEYDYNKIINKH